MTHAISFNDGKTAQRHKAAARIDADTLVIANEAGGELARWSLTDIRYADPAHRTPPLRLRNAGTDARITLPADDDGAWLTAHCANLTRRDAGAVKWPTWVAAGILALASITGIFIYLLPAASSAIVRIVPAALEQRIGAEARDHLLNIFGQLRENGTPLVCHHPDAQAILDTRANELATLMESPFPVRVTVVRFPVVNALTLPGGEVIILSGLLDKAENADAVIGVLAHEIAHVVRRDPLQVSIKQTGAALMISLVVGDVFGGAALGGLASGLIENGYSRDAEAASDFLAVTALNQLGLTALPLADFVAGMGKEDPMAGVVPSFLNTHPGGDERRRDITRLSQGMGRAMSSYEWKTVKNMCR
ncbi:M48 family metallopeptidase [Thalassospiraceae bacterium LMO-JJ14]|nr:M48 family metallopeptidase [Thalassospiraceae bacterium LMO-JJ14]